MTKTNYILSETRKKPYVSPLFSVVVEDLELGVMQVSGGAGPTEGGQHNTEDFAKESTTMFYDPFEVDFVEEEY